MNELKFTPESEALEPHKLMCLYDLGPDQQRELSEAVEKSKGRIRLFVHPFYEQMVTDKKGTEELDRKTTELLMRSGGEKSVPVFFLESATSAIESLPFFEDVLQQNPDIFSNIYYVITHPNQSTPCPELRSRRYDLISGGEDRKVGENFKIIFDDKNGQESELNNQMLEEQEGARWAEYCGFLKRLGVKEIIVGGQSLTIERTDKPDIPDGDELSLPEELTAVQAEQFIEESYIPGFMEAQQGERSLHADYLQQREKAGAKNTDYFLGQCVGSAIRHLSKDFKIMPSNLAYPESRADIRRIENE